METPRPPIYRIFSPVKLLKRYLNRLFNKDFLAFYTKENLSTGWGYPKFGYGSFGKPPAFPRIYFPCF
nr:MAG TPA: hypothetical protein [Caudoviricetes sp.]